MNLLTCHGTMLRVDPGSGAWLHAVLWPVDPRFTDLDLAVSGLVAPRLLPGAVVEPAAEPERLHLRRDDHYAGAERHAALLAFNRLQPGKEEKFMPVAAAALARLRRILGSEVRLAETGQPVQPRMAENFCLRVGVTDYPVTQIDDAGAHRVALRAGSHTLTLVLGTPLPPPSRLILQRRAADLPIAKDAAAFKQGSGQSVILAEQEELALPPLTVSDEDQIWMQRHAWWWESLRWGLVAPQYKLVHKRDVLVLMSAPVEGTILDEGGIYTDSSFVFNVPVTGRDHFSRSYNDVSIDRQAISAARPLAGPHVVFSPGEVGDYYHWLIKVLVPLRAMLPYLPPGTRLLLPSPRGAGRAGSRGDPVADHIRMLDEWGFADLPYTISSDPVCKLEEAYWIANDNVSSIPAVCLEAASRHAKSLRPTVEDAGGGKRIYVRHTGERRVQNASEVEAAMESLGFTVHEMRDLSTRQQLALFASATFVLAPHGADLANIIFCAPGTKVIELSPDAHFRPFFCQISNKMGLSHAILPCATTKPGFDSDILVDLSRLHAIIGQMLAWS
jgi:hypothetical protein